MAVGFPAKTTYANGDVFSASDINDTNGTLNLLTSAQFAAGKNKIINGDFRINQRAFTSNTTNNTYNFDRWIQVNGGTTGTLTVTPQTFTPGAAPVAGYEGSTFVQCVTASGASTDTYAIEAQRIEDVRSFAGQTVTVSFWAKAGSGTPKIGVEFEQFFGTGGSPSSAVEGITGGAVTLSTSWARYTANVSIPSISGKTIGTNANSSFLNLRLWLSAGSTYNALSSSIGLQNNTFQIWGVQVEAGSTATAFQTATGTIQGELAACQRYYFRMTTDALQYLTFGQGAAQSSTLVEVQTFLPVTTRVQAVTIDYANLQVQQAPAGTVYNVTGLSIGVGAGRNLVSTQLQVASGLTTGTIYRGLLNGSSSTSYIGFSAEL